MSSFYIYDPVETDPTVLEQDAITWIQARWPQWTPADGNLETWLIGALSQMIAEGRDVASDVPRSIFRYFGKSILGLPAIDATSAVVNSTWTFTSNPAGRTVTAGTMVIIPGLDGGSVIFEVVANVVVASPTLTTPVGAVTLRALNPGLDGSGLGGAGTLATLIDPVAWVGTIALVGATSGGADAEDDDSYLNRLSGRLTLLSPRPILPRDFELLAVDIALQNGVKARALAVDGYDPATLTYLNERMVFVALVDQVTGANVPGAILTAVDTQLELDREVNFVVNVGNPTRTTFDVTFDLVVLPNYVAADVLADAIANVTAALSPANWGLPPGQEGSAWIQVDTLRRQDVSTALNNTMGVAYWTTLTIGYGGGAQTTAETFPLTGAAPLAQAGAITGTAS